MELYSIISKSIKVKKRKSSSKQFYFTWRILEIVQIVEMEKQQKRVLEKNENQNRTEEHKSSIMMLSGFRPIYLIRFCSR